MRLLELAFVLACASPAFTKSWSLNPRVWLVKDQIAVDKGTGTWCEVAFKRQH
jgi:hypothetical protein